jgi:hypothetical protein
MCAEASVPLHCHTNSLTRLHSDFPELLQNYGITASFMQHRERVLFVQSSQSSALSNKG